MKTTISAVMATLLVYGCSATGPQYTKATVVPLNKGTIYLYRPSKFIGAGITPSVFVDDKQLFKLKREGYAEIQVSYGLHTLETRKDSNFLTDDAPGAITIAVNPGEDKYIRWEPSMEDLTVIASPTVVAVGRFHGKFIEVNQSQAEEEIREFKRIYP